MSDPQNPGGPRRGRGGGLNVVRASDVEQPSPPPRVTSTPPRAPAPRPPPPPSLPPEMNADPLNPDAPVPMSLTDLLSAGAPPARGPSVPGPEKPAPERMVSAPGAAASPPERMSSTSGSQRRPPPMSLDPELPPARPPPPPPPSPSVPPAAPPRAPAAPRDPSVPAPELGAAARMVLGLSESAASPAEVAPAGPSLGARLADVGLLLRSAAPGLLGVAALVVVVGLASVFSGPSPPGLETHRRLTSLWLRHGDWGRPRTDVVIYAVDAVGMTVVPPLSAALGPRTPRFVVMREASKAAAVGLPDGTVVITTGLLRRLRSEAELAAVLAHALAHIAAGHPEARLLDDPALTEEVAWLETNQPHKAVPLVNRLAHAAAGDEAAATAAALEAVKAAGWVPAAVGLIHTRLEGTAWAAAHPIDQGLRDRLLTASSEGRDNADAYARTILARVGGAP